MQLITRQLPDNHNFFSFGDQHKGSALSTHSGWLKLIDMMHSPYDGCSNNYGADGGDMIEAIRVDDKRFSPDKLSEDLPLDQMDEAVKDREAIKNILLYILQGNHEYSMWRDGDVTAKICGRLGVPYGTNTTKLIVKDIKGNPMYKLYDQHGRRMITSTADDPIRRHTNLELTLKRQLKFKAGDCAVMIKHHVHKLLVCAPEHELFLTDDGERIKQGYTSSLQSAEYIHPDDRWYGCAGSFLKLFGMGVSGYAEMAEYDPVELGFLVLKVRDRKIVGLDPIFLNI